MAKKNHQDPMSLLALGALGIVYGDIGTSPLYAIRESLLTLHGSLAPENVLGVLSLVFWAITLIVSLKYVILVMRADNHGEGGILALLALVLSSFNKAKNKNLLMLGLLGAALFFGDGIITPAISVLSALEGLSIVSPVFNLFIVPLGVVILTMLFWYQENGSGAIGRLFGPVMLVWFFILGILGALGTFKNPEVFYALNPKYAILFLIHHPWSNLATLGAVILAVTGAEALYADMGHFGKPPIRRAWFCLVYPALILNYFGQGAILLQNPEALKNPFYYLVPEWGLVPMIILATAATIIASQALISGVFSIAWQAIQLNFLPRMHVRHTSQKQIGQVYVSVMNWIFLILTTLVVMLFRNSSALASAYGFAVSGLMVITTILTIVVARRQWKWNVYLTYLIFAPFLMIETAFFIATSFKIHDGAWLPLVLGAFIFLILSTWYTGRETLKGYAQQASMSYKELLGMLIESQPLRVAGNAIYMAGTPSRVPSAFVINYKHNKVIHERLIFLSIIIEDIPHVPSKNRLMFENLGEDVFRIRATYGFMEVPNITVILEKCKAEGLHMDPEETTVFLTRGIPFATEHPQMPQWRTNLYILLAKNAMNATEFFRIPYSRVIELGARWRL